MSESLRIAVADDELDMRDYFEKMLPRMGHQVVSVAETGRQLVDHCRAQRPDLIITDVVMPDMDGIEAAMEIYRDGPVPVILVSAHQDPTLVERASADHILAYLIKPIKQADLAPAISIAMRRFEQFLALGREAADLRQALEDRKIIERAKGVLMKTAHYDEHDAFHRLQQLARANNKKLVEVAASVLLAGEALSPDAPA